MCRPLGGCLAPISDVCSGIAPGLDSPSLASSSSLHLSSFWSYGPFRTLPQPPSAVLAQWASLLAPGSPAGMEGSLGLNPALSLCLTCSLPFVPCWTAQPCHCPRAESATRVLFSAYPACLSSEYVNSPLSLLTQLCSWPLLPMMSPNEKRQLIYFLFLITSQL